jgi:hypothetical protein
MLCDAEVGIIFLLTFVSSVPKGKFHTPKYQKGKRIVRLSEADVDRLLSLKRHVNAKDDDWMFPNRIKKGGQKLKPGSIWHEHILARHIQRSRTGWGCRTSPGVSSGTGERRNWSAVEWTPKWFSRGWGTRVLRRR